MNENTKDLFTRLAAPFHPDDIEWRAGATNADKSKALALAYITSRAVMDRLDEIIGPENWRDEYAPGPDGGVICGLSLRIQEEWICKWDGAENTDFEPVKGGLSDAFKRAGYKWGIGRYLYKLESVWVPCEMHGKSISLKSTPPLPAWALPNEWRDPSGRIVNKAVKSPKELEQEILKELGFGNKLEAVPVSQAAVAAPVAPTIPKGNGSNGNGVNPKSASPQASLNGKRAMSWGTAQVEALLKSKLAANPVEAVHMLNESGLTQDANPQQVVEHFKK
jgi:hypothetical protein